MKKMPRQLFHIVIEGLPGAGKTTLINRWCQDPRCVLIPDIGNPKFLEKDFFIDKQYIMYQEILKHHLVNLSKFPFVLQERNYLSVLAFHKALEIKGVETCYKDVFTMISNLIKKRQLTPPDLIQIIDICPEESTKFQPSVMMELWKDVTGLGIIRDFYRDYSLKPMFGEVVNLYKSYREVPPPWELYK